jgi:death on curing protein
LTGDVLYLDVEDVLGFYAAIFGITERQAADHLRDRNLLESALQWPKQYAHYQDADLPTQAAAIAHGIAENQPFVDGNKRTAYVAVSAFLEFNLCGLACSQEELAQWLIDLATGATMEDLAEHIRRRIIYPNP